MTSYRFFMIGFLFTTCIVFIGDTLCAQTNVQCDRITIREGNNNIVVEVDIPLAQGGCMMLYSVNDDCSTHKTSKKNPFDHIHVHYAFPISGAVIVNGIRTNTQKQITDDNVRAYWDWWFGIEAGQRENVETFGNDGGEDATYNCWGYSLGYSTWIQDPDPIYNDGYESTSNPSEGDVIRRNGHVISITSINQCESPYLVIGTSEKNQYSGIYNFLYEYSSGIGDESYKDFYTPVP